MTIQFYNIKTRKFNNIKTARKNGILNNPDSFIFPENIGFNRKKNRFVLFKNLIKDLNNNIINDKDIIIQGYFYNKFSKRFNKKTKTNIKKYEEKITKEKETEAINKIKKFLKKIVMKKKEEQQNKTFSKIMILKMGFDAEHTFEELHKKNLKEMIKEHPNGLYKHIINFYENNELKKSILFKFNKYDKKLKNEINYRLNVDYVDWLLPLFFYKDYENEYNINSNNKKIEVIYEAYKKIDKSKINNSDKDEQEYRENETGDCVYLAMLEYFKNKESRDGKQIYNRLLKKAYIYKKPYTDKNIDSIAKLCNSSIIIYDLINLKHKIFNENSLNKFRVEMINTRYNHLELKLMTNNDILNINKNEYEEIKKNCSFYVEKNGELHTINKIKTGYEKINDDYEIPTYKTEYNIYSKKNDLYNEVVNKWKVENNFSNLSMPINNKHYEFLNNYDYSLFRFMKKLKLTNDIYKELDLKSAYFRALDKNFNQFYCGVPSGSWLSFENDGTFDINKLDSDLIGFFEVKIISDKNDDIHKIFKTGSNHFLFSPTLKYIMSKGVDIYIKRGMYCPAMDLKFNDDFKKECGYKLKIYCKFFGCLLLENKDVTIEIKNDEFNEKYFSLIDNKDYEIFYNDNKIIMKKDLEEPFTFKHIAFMIHSYTKLKVLDKILNIGYDNIEGVKIDSIVVKKEVNFNECEEWKLKEAKITEMFNTHFIEDDYIIMTDSYTTDFYESKQSEIKFNKTFLTTGDYLYKRVLFVGGPGGTGKTYSILNNDNIIDYKRVVFSSFCWNLIQNISAKYPAIIPASTPKITGEMNEIKVDKITKKYNFIICDEATLTDEEQYKKICNDNKHCFIFLLGDIDHDGFFYQCRSQNNVINPSSINCQYVKYNKSYRFSEELNEKLIKLRKIMKKIYIHNNDYNRIKILYEYIKQEFKENFFNKEDIIYKNNFIGISCLNDNGEKTRKHTEYFIEKDNIKPRYYIKQTNLKKNELAGREVLEPSNNTYSTLFKTIHSFQGLELNNDQKIIIIIDKLFDFNLLYTALSRARRSDQIIIIDDR